MFEQIIEFSMNHPLLVSAFVILLVLVIINEAKSSAQGVTAREAIRLLNKDEAIVLDIRDRKDFAAGHITGSVHIPMTNLDKRIDELKKHESKTIIVVCKMGNTAAAAVAKLNKAGYAQAVKLKGGMMQWQTEALPLVKK